MRNSLAIGLICLGSSSVFARFEPIAIELNAVPQVFSTDAMDRDAVAAWQESPLARTLESFPVFTSNDPKLRLQLAQKGSFGGGEGKGKFVGRILDEDSPTPAPKTNPNKAPDLKDLPTAGPGGRKRPPAMTGADPYVSKFPAGSIDDSLSSFCTAIEDDDFATASDYIAQNVKGLAGLIRDGEMTEEKMADLKNAISPIRDLDSVPNRNDTSKRTLRNSKNQTITFGLKKEKDVYRITDISVSAPKKLSPAMERRQQQRNNSRSNDD